MKESTTYQAILEEGRANEARRWLLKTGENLFKTVPSSAVTAKVNNIQDAEELERLGDRMWTVKSWEELLSSEQSEAIRPSQKKSR